MIQERPMTGTGTFLAITNEKEQRSDDLTYWVFLFSSVDQCFQDSRQMISSPGNFHPVQYQQ